MPTTVGQAKKQLGMKPASKGSTNKWLWKGATTPTKGKN